jgi:hypothetical protein
MTNLKLRSKEGVYVKKRIELGRSDVDIYPPKANTLHHGTDLGPA